MSLACHSLSLWVSKHGLESTAQSTGLPAPPPAPSASPCSGHASLLLPRTGAALPPGLGARHSGRLEPSAPHLHTARQTLLRFLLKCLLFRGGSSARPVKATESWFLLRFYLFTRHMLRPGHSSKPGGAHLLHNAASLQFCFYFICLVSTPDPAMLSIAWDVILSAAPTSGPCLAQRRCSVNRC